MEFGEFLRSKREAKRMTIRQLALYAGCSAGYISMLERGVVGQRGPTPTFLRKLYTPLGVPYEVLMAAAGYQLEIEDETLYPGSLVLILRESLGEEIDEFSNRFGMSSYEVETLEKKGVSYETLSGILKSLFGKVNMLPMEQRDVIRSIEDTFQRLPTGVSTRFARLIADLLAIMNDQIDET